jgi:aspartate racemase
MASNSLGILGLGSVSTLFYVKEINKRYGGKKGNSDTCPFRLLNVNFNEINNLLPSTSTELDKIVGTQLAKLAALGANTILVPNITLHETVDRLELGQAIVHPVFSTILSLKEKQIAKVVLVGSLHSMQSHYLKSHFEENGIEVTKPSLEDMELADEVRKRVYNEVASQDLLQQFNQMLEKYALHNAVVIACTELSVALSSTMPQILDMARLQIGCAVEKLF